MTKKQKMFIEEYQIDLNATQAAIRVGCSPDTAKEIGCDNLTKPNIRTHIDQALAERSKRTGVNADRVVVALLKNLSMMITWQTNIPLTLIVRKRRQAVRYESESEKRK